MKTVMISQEDAAQVKAILLTHAEMQDHRTIESMTILGRLKHDEPEEVDMIALLKDQVDDFENDTDNLKRIAQIF